jgi:DNA repair photolyase
LRDGGKNLDETVRACFLVAERLGLENTVRKEIWVERDACEIKSRECFPRLEAIRNFKKRALRTGLNVKPIETQKNEMELRELQDILAELNARMRKLKELGKKIW